MLLKKTILILLIFSTIANAEDKVVRLVKGDPSPYSGVLMPESKASEIKVQLLDYDNLKLINASYIKSIDLYKANELDYNTKIKMFSDQNDNLAKNLNESRSVSEWTKFGYFMLGVLGTTAAVYGLKKVTQ